MQLKTQEVERVYGKLGMVRKGGHHKMAFFYHGEKLILKTRLSHGSGDAKAADKIRQDFKLNESDFRNLIDCPLTKDGYVQKLRDKGFLQ